MAAKAALLAVMASFLLAAPTAMSSKRQGFRVTMIRTETAINYTRAAYSSRQRLSILAARLDAAAGASTQTPLQYDRGGGAYNMEFSIGTPPLNLLAQADTGSDLVWVKCGGCASCSPQGSPSYYPDMSSSFSNLSCSDPLCVALQSAGNQCSHSGAECDYLYRYGSSTDAHHYTQGFLGSETVTLGGDAVPGIGFGCTTMSEGGFGTGSGLVGLGRGQLSLVRQLQVGSFSYCLPSDPSKKSPLLFGSGALTGDGVQSTPLLQTRDTFYTVNLQGISIGSVTTAGTNIVFDSGTTLTLLADPVYTAAKNAILSQTALPQADHSSDGYEACFVATENDISGAAPKMVLHFDGADMDLPVDNYFRDMGDGSMCWVVQSSPAGGLSIVGNIMQMNYNIRHDIDNFVLSFQPANCDTV
ncbi:unnamed protein product [Urochloa decumbens]|uniref:Peptidase A1 domain-containing protein n=1 Tax=Urochloa decumbens TaxID=240449 RepID=A0ABC9AUW8_9POAL